MIELSGISKHFGGTQALKNVSLALEEGQVMALIGENGAGKSTLVKILTGIYQPTKGIIKIHGIPQSFPSPLDATYSGITAIHQETVLFDDLSVAENIFIGHFPKTKLGLIDWKRLNQDARDLLNSVGADCSPTMPLQKLSIANKHLVAIARALSVNARVVIMDEPTASLSHQEVQALYDLIYQLKSQNKAILFISHKFEDIFQIADCYTVFRDGEEVGTGDMTDTTQDELVQMMVGRSVEQIFPKTNSVIGKTILEVQNLTHQTEFKDISFSICKGEILGFYGLVGAGRSEVMQALFGMKKCKGKVLLKGQPIQIKHSNDAIAQGIVYVPEDRGKQGVITELPIFQNVTLPSLKKIARYHFLQLAKEFQLTHQYTQRLDLKASALNQNVNELSGGNQQKVVIAKWLATQPQVVMIDEPTKGIDIGSKAAVHQFISELASQGLAVMMVSSEIPEIMGMSDRAIVIRHGQMVAEFDRKTMTPEKLVKAASGLQTD